MRNLTSRELEYVNGGDTYHSVINAIGDIMSVGGVALIVAGAFFVARNKKIVLDDTAQGITNDVRIVASIETFTGVMLMGMGLLTSFAGLIGSYTLETPNEDCKSGN